MAHEAGYKFVMLWLCCGGEVFVHLHNVGLVHVPLTAAALESSYLWLCLLPTILALLVVPLWHLCSCRACSQQSLGVAVALAALTTIVVPHALLHDGVG